MKSERWERWRSEPKRPRRNSLSAGPPDGPHRRWGKGEAGEAEHSRVSKGDRSVASGATLPPLTLNVWLLLVVMVGRVWGAGVGGGLKEPAVITGDQLELRDHGQVAVFIGNVRMTHGKSVMTAQRMTQEKATDLVHAEGEVHLLTETELGELVNAHGDFGLYDQRLARGRLWGQAWLTRELPGKPDDRMKMTAKAIEHRRPERQLHGYETVRIEDQDSWATAEKAVYYEDDRRVVLTGGTPVVFEETLDGSHLGRGETVTFWPDTRRLLLVGHAQGTFRIRRKAPSS